MEPEGISMVSDKNLMSHGEVTYERAGIVVELSGVCDSHQRDRTIDIDSILASCS
jgi:hypothetical protein